MRDNRSEGRKEFDKKHDAFEKWYEGYIRSRDVGNPKKWKEFARWAFMAGIDYERVQVEQLNK